jgi:molybdopterin-dependent oxidoreductase alpha subunit
MNRTPASKSDQPAAHLRARRWVQDHFPLGLLHPNKPRHLRGVAQAIIENSGQWHDAWKVLNGPCNGCAVQTDGLRDNVMPHHPHFCLIRLGLIEEALRDPFDVSRFADVRRLRRRRNRDIERMGRIPQPMLRRRGRHGFEPIDFDQAYDLAAEWIGASRGDRSAYFTTSKAVANEEYFAFQQFARTVGGTNNVDSCARQCHAASVAALKATVGIGASSGSLADFRDADLLVLAGTNLANNQPLVMRYIVEGRIKRGGLPRVIVVNCYREPGLERYWVPSNIRSALTGTTIADRFVQVRVGGDVAFFNGVMKVLIDDSLLTERHRAMIDLQTTGFDELKTALESQSFDELERRGGVPRAAMAEVARELARTEHTVFCWGMGLTQHHHGTDNVKAVVNLALALGQVGRPRSGLAPLRGQSSVQAAGECGVAGTIFPGGDGIDADSAARLSEMWGAEVPNRPGMPTARMIEAAHRCDLDCIVSLGGNLPATLPGSDDVADALRRTRHRIRFDVMMNHEALIEPGEALLVIPIRNWYEWDHVFTTTSTDRTIRAFKGTIRPRVPDALESWQALRAIAQRVMGATDDGLPRGFAYRNTDDLRAAMDRDIWMYRGIAALDAPHKQMQWGGPYLYAGGFDRMEGGRAVFSPLVPKDKPIPDGHFRVSTRRGFGQWNSQHRTGVAKDSFTAARGRRDALINPADAAALNLEAGDALTLVAANRRLTTICRPDPATLPRHIQLFWPYANELIPLGVYDDPTCEPDYNVFARVERG